MVSDDICCNNSPTRQDRLKSWLVLHRKTVRSVASDTGLCRSVAHEIFSGHRAPKAQIERLIAYGIPAELLPKPREPQKRGPKPKQPTVQPIESDDPGLDLAVGQ